MTDEINKNYPTKRVRPRFRVTIPYSVDELLKRVNSALADKKSDCRGQLYRHYGTIFIPAEEQHYWSPQLGLTVEENEEGVILRGLCGPRPVVWTMFVFFYSLIAFVTLVIGIYGLSKLTLGTPATVLWLVPVLILVFLSLFLTAHIGKKKGYEQMLRLYKFIEKSTGLEINRFKPNKSVD